MTLNELAKQAKEIADSKGFTAEGYSPLDIHMLIVSEVAEATECVRNGEPDLHWVLTKPEGEAVELVDAFIRIAQYFALKGWDLEKVVKAKMDYNKTRSYRHGNKKY